MDDPQRIRFYFSFRSPYAWLAAEKLESEFAGLDVDIALIPIYPTPETFPNDPVATPNKSLYFAQDITRLTRAMGLELRKPCGLEADWSVAHAAYLGAESLGHGLPFMLEMFRSRWCRSLDIGLDEVIAETATRCGADADATVAAAHAPDLRATVDAAFQKGIDEDGIFGVPSFIHAERLYWGQDRMHFLREAVERAAAKASSRG